MKFGILLILLIQISLINGKFVSAGIFVAFFATLIISQIKNDESMKSQ